MALHSLRTRAGMSLSVVDEFESISLIASLMSCGENKRSLMVADFRGWVGSDFSVLLGSLNTDLYWSWRMLAISRGLFVRAPSLSRGPTLDLHLANLLA